MELGREAGGCRSRDGTREGRVTSNTRLASVCRASRAQIKSPIQSMRVTISRSRGLASPERSEPDDQPNQSSSSGKPPLDRQAECHLTGLGSPRTRVRKGERAHPVHMPPAGTSPKKPPRSRWGSHCHVADRATTSPAGTPALRPFAQKARLHAPIPIQAASGNCCEGEER